MLTKPRYKLAGEIERFDERENVQSRNTLEPGTAEYAEFYARFPQWEAVDAKTREISKQHVGHPLDGLFLEAEIMSVARRGMEDLVDGPVAEHKFELSPERASEKLKGFARVLGADLVRTGPLNPAFIYTHIGKTWQDPARKHGAPITLAHRHAVSIAIGLDTAIHRSGPVLAMSTDVMSTYNKLATIATILAAYIRSLGHPARAHVVSNYQVLCVPIAIEAGMGELGRHGIMLTKELGSCLKLATITTDLPLAHDLAVDIGVDEFCKDCRICAERCPSGAISRDAKRVVRGVEKWSINPQACFRVWNETGTDCGICVSACPWSKPRTAFHRFAALLATRKKKAGWWMSRAEKLFYGAYYPKPGPAYFETPDPIWEKYPAYRRKR
jgi:reductive dehalogenase